LGSTSGSVTIAAPAVAGSTTITLPATSGTLLQSGTAVTVAQGGTGLTAGTSGGVPYFSGTTTVASSAALTANGVVYGGGAGNAPVATAAGTTGQFLGANTGAAPTWQTPSGGGSPGGSNTQVQFNNSSAFGGSANFVWDGTYVGVGTSSPSTYGDSTPGAVTYNSTAGGRSGISLGSNSTAANDILGAVNFFSSNTSNTNYRMAKILGMRGADANSSYLRFDTANSAAPAERMRLDSSGNLGLGATPSPWDSTCTAIQIGGTAAVSSTSTGTQLDVVNNVYLASGSYNYRTSAAATFYRQGSSGTHGFYVAPAGTAGASMSFGPVALQVNNDKSVSIPNGTLNCAGITSGTVYGTTVTTPRNVFVDSSGSFGGISSTRESKTNIAPLRSASWVQQLNPVTFNYRKKDETGTFTDEFESENQFGLIADEVEAVAPDFCIYVNDKLQGIHYDRMIAPLIKAVQELSATNEALTARIAALEAK